MRVRVSVSIRGPLRGFGYTLSRGEDHRVRNVQAEAREARDARAGEEQGEEVDSRTDGAACRGGGRRGASVREPGAGCGGPGAWWWCERVGLLPVVKGRGETGVGERRERLLLCAEAFARLRARGSRRCRRRSRRQGARTPGPDTEAAAAGTRTFVLDSPDSCCTRARRRVHAALRS